MKKVLVAYFSATGRTQTMAQYIAEGIRFNGHQALVKNITEINGAPDLEGFDGIIVGSPTFSLEVPGPMKHFMDVVASAKMSGKLAGAFGPYRHEESYGHDSFAPARLLETLIKQNNMIPFELSSLSLKDDNVETNEGIRASQDYGRVFGEKLGKL